MYTNYNIPQKRYYKPQSSNNYYQNGDRFLGSGFLGPFILGGITGGLIARPNYPPYPQPIPVYFPPNQYPPYINTNVYY